MQSLRVWLTPDLVDPQTLRGTTAVVIDVLRATTTILEALDNGARAVYPCVAIDEARETSKRLAPPVLLGGERGGRRIDGFDVGNSPSEYSRERVEGAAIVFTTTNGTRAMQQCHAAQQVLLAAFSNLSAVADQLVAESQVDVVCAGTNGEVTREDVLLAGALVEAARDSASPPEVCNDQAQLAGDAWRAAVGELRSGPLADVLRDSGGGRNLIEIGQERDVEWAAQIDRCHRVPRVEFTESGMCVPAE